jgi:MFS family permease
LPKTQSKFLLPLLFIGVLMGALDIAIIGPALPAIQAEFDMNNRQLAVLFNAYVLCQMLGTQLLAKLADRMGTRIIYITGISLFALGSLMLVIASDMYTLYAGRAIQGFGAGGIFPVASTVIAAGMSAEKRGAALGLLGTVWGIAFLIGPILGGVLLQFSWHWLFLVNLPIAAVLIVGAFRLLPKEPAHRQRPFDLAGAVTLSTAMTALVMGINNIDTAQVMDSLVSLSVSPYLLIVAVMLPLFWHFEKRAADPIIRPGMLASRQISTACLLAGGIGAMQTAGIFFPVMAVAAMDVSVSEAAFLLIPGVVLSTIASPIIGRLINVVGTRAIVLTALVLGMISFSIYGSVQLDVQTFLIANLISGLSSAGLVGAPLRWTILNESLPQERAAAQGLLSNVTSVGRLIGAATVGAVATAKGGGVGGYQSAFLGMVILAASLFALALTLKSKSAEQKISAEAEAAATA